MQFSQEHLKNLFPFFADGNMFYTFFYFILFRPFFPTNNPWVSARSRVHALLVETRSLGTHGLWKTQTDADAEGSAEYRHGSKVCPAKDREPSKKGGFEGKGAGCRPAEGYYKQMVAHAKGAGPGYLATGHQTSSSVIRMQCTREL